MRTVKAVRQPSVFGGLDRLARHARSMLGRYVDVARIAWRTHSPQGRAMSRRRADCHDLLDGLSREQIGARPATTPRRVLIDGAWDNPNYWLRYALLRSALGLSRSEEIGLLGRHRRAQASAAFRAFGVTNMIDAATTGAMRRRAHGETADLIERTASADDILSWSLPRDFPPAMAYDGVLKRQRGGVARIDHPLFADQIAEMFAAIHAAESALDQAQPDLVVLSHAVDFTYGALAHFALRRGVPVIVLYGDYGVQRFFRLTRPEDLFAYPSRPTDTARFLDEKRLDRFARLGASYLDARFAGETRDLGAQYAYQRRCETVTRDSLCERFGWRADRPIVGVYNSNWFDFPHASGLREFRDFADWIEQTLRIAGERADVQWLFKAHPCDEWYGVSDGVTLEQMVARAGYPNVAIADANWQGVQLIDALDGVVTCHGTIGVEAAYRGKPVVTPYAGWYGHCGFTLSALSSDDYRHLLRRDWWRDWDADRARRRASAFAGWCFGAPAWHGDYVMQDDSAQDRIYDTLPEFLTQHRAALAHERRAISDWVASGEPYYHIFKMNAADSGAGLSA